VCLSQTMHLKMSHLTLISRRNIYIYFFLGLAECLLVRSEVRMLKSVFLEKLRKNSPKTCIFTFLLNAFLHLHKRTLLSVLTSLHRESPCVKLFLLVDISVLCVSKCCRVGEVVQSVGHEHSVSLSIGRHAQKVQEPHSPTLLLSHFFTEDVMLVLLKITYCDVHTTVNQYWKSSRALNILSKGHMWPAGLQLYHASSFSRFT